MANDCTQHVQSVANDVRSLPQNPLRQLIVMFFEFELVKHDVIQTLELARLMIVRRCHSRRYFVGTADNGSS